MNQAIREEKTEILNEQMDCQCRLLVEKISCCIEAARNNATREELAAQLEDIRITLLLTGNL